MDALILGQAISALRKKQGLTQAMLADKLGLSDKTISKWESGRCYPDVTVIPKLAEIFSVTTDVPSATLSIAVNCDCISVGKPGYGKVLIVSIGFNFLAAIISTSLLFMLFICVLKAITI